MSGWKLDEVDFEILRWLDREGTVDAAAISRKLGISESTVYYRCEKFEEAGVLGGNVASLDAEKLGLEITAVTEIERTDGPGYDRVGERLSDISGVKAVYFMQGETSYLVISKLRDYDHLREFVDDVIHTEGVGHSSTSLVLDTVKEESRLLVNYDDGDLDELVESAGDRAVPSG